MKRLPKVALLRDPRVVRYSDPPFDPPERYPEIQALPGGGRDPRNRVYRMVRECLRLLGLDGRHYGTPAWNPLGATIRPGQKVLINPNFVTDKNREVEGREGQLALVTHGSVLRAVVDYAYKACGPNGTIVIADTPLEESTVESFHRIADFTGTRAFVDALRKRGVPVRLLDLRSGIHHTYGRGETIRTLSGDGRGYVHVDLGRKSLYEPLSAHARGFQTGSWKRVSRYHSAGRHLYSISRSALESDAVLSVAKLKTHKKVGATLTLKNLFGLCDRKDWVPHWTSGLDEAERPDPAFIRTLKRAVNLPGGMKAYGVAARFVSWRLGGFGNWQGNDTIWRGVLDVVRILRYGDAGGRMHASPQRTFFGFIDGIIAGEGESPLGPAPRPFGAILAGGDLVAVDAVGCRVMGLAPERTRYLPGALLDRDYPVTDCLRLSGIRVEGTPIPKAREPFRLPSGWDPG